MKNAFALIALASCAAAPCEAASPLPVPENLQACSKLPDATERVRCYDTEIAKMSASAATPRAVETAPAAPTATHTAAPAASASTSATAASAATATAATPVGSAVSRGARQSAESKFGEETLPATARPNPRPPEEAMLLSSITGVQTVGQEKYAISLANGQVWRQEEASQLSLFFRVGDSVRIEKGALGSYHMSTDKTGAKNWVRVTRIR